MGDGEGEVERWKAQSEKYRSQLLSEKRAFSDARAALEKAAAQAREEADKFRCVLYRNTYPGPDGENRHPNIE